MKEMTGRPARPNVVVILADDMGFSDIGCFGSEIRTPHIDRLAREGVALSSFYNAARCCPTRASLLTGLHPHNAGIGHMGADLGSPAYQGFLREDAATIAEVLRTDGYRTLLSGKWHVGGDYDARRVDLWRPGDPRHPTPLQRGFDRFYGIVDGAGSLFEPHYLMEDDRRIEVTAPDYYFTAAVTDKAIEMVEESQRLEQPFFLYLGYTAPHWPLHAPPEDIARYDGLYLRGWDRIRAERHEALIGGGILERPWALSPRDAEAPAWSDCRLPDWEASRMAVYAAMIDCMDQGIGRLMGALARLGLDDDTLVFFLSDNGGCAELMAEDGWAKWYPDRLADGRTVHKGNRPELRPGGADSFMSYDLPWANASNAPFRLFKHWVHEGGISTPLLARWPARFGGPRVQHQPCQVVDLLPTILEATGARYSSETAGGPLQALNGESFLPLLEGRRWQREQPIFWEHEGNGALRQGQWKLVRRHGRPWELYDMEADRTELDDRAAREPERLRRMAREHAALCEASGVRDWDVLLPVLERIWS